jgi:hypothetical protein
VRRRACFAPLLAVLALSACGSDDDGDEKDSAAKKQDTKAQGGTTFEASDVGFTFSHPAEFKQDDSDEGKVLARVKLDEENGFNIRKTSDQEVTPSFYLDEFERDFERSPEVGDVEKRTERHSGQEMGVLVIADAPSAVPGSKERIRAEEYFFAGKGNTWQLECLSTKEKRSEVDAACAQALESIKFR